MADALLAKWMGDDDAGECWERLGAAVTVKQGHLLKPTPAQPVRVFKYWVILWYVSMGYSVIDCAEQLGVSTETIKQELRYVRKQLGMAGKPLPLVVATAIRQGRIP